jgi:hypothetical protein
MTDGEAKASGCGCGVVFIVALLCLLIYRGSSDHTTITVTRTESISTGDSHKYLVFTDGEVFQCTDSVAFMRFNSSDVYGQLAAGHKYRVRVAGWRIPILSSYRNIMDVSPAGP